MLVVVLVQSSPTCGRNRVGKAAFTLHLGEARGAEREHNLAPTNLAYAEEEEEKLLLEVSFLLANGRIQKDFVFPYLLLV